MGLLLAVCEHWRAGTEIVLHSSWYDYDDSDNLSPREFKRSSHDLVELFCSLIRRKGCSKWNWLDAWLISPSKAWRRFSLQLEMAFLPLYFEHLGQCSLNCV